MTELLQPNLSVRVGQILRGKYRVERVLGAGGMGAVVAATHLRLDRPVAIKLLRPALVGKPAIVARFAREARAAAKLKSDHVVRILDVDDDEGGEPFLVMELLQGHDLQRAIDDGPLNVARAVEYVLQACVAVAEAHAHGIVHRDLKPANLFLTPAPDGSARVKLLDFGISKAMEAEGGNLALTDATAMVGSPYFMSPEQLRSAHAVDARTDIWSLGVVLYQLVTGSLPFRATQATELAARIAADPPSPITRADVPEALRAVVARCLEKQPSARYPTAIDLARALAPFAGDAGPRWVWQVERAAQSSALDAALAATIPSSPVGAEGARRTASLAESARERDVSSLPPSVPTTTEYGSVGAAGPSKSLSLRARWATGLIGVVFVVTLAWTATRRASPPMTKGAAPDQAAAVTTSVPPIPVHSSPTVPPFVDAAANAPVPTSTRRSSTAPGARRDPLQIDLK